MACRFGTCEINNNRSKPKKSATKTKKVSKSCCPESCSEWSDSDDSCSGCSACCGSSSNCSCSECNMETDSDIECQGSARNSRARTQGKKNKGKVLICRNGVCEWVSQKKVKRSTKKVPEKKNTKKTKSSRKCC